MVNLTPEEIRRRLLGEQPRLAVEDEEEDDGGGVLGFLGRTLGDTLGELTNAERFFGEGIERLTLGQVSGGDIARLTGLSRAPEPVRDLLNIAASPAGILAASPGTAAASQALRQSPRLLTRAAGNVIQPFPFRSPVARLGVESGSALAGETVTREAQERGVPTPLAVGLGLGAGIGTATGATSVLTRGGRAGLRDLTRRPTRVSVRPTQVEEGARKGNLLRAKTAEQLAQEKGRGVVSLPGADTPLSQGTSQEVLTTIRGPLREEVGQRVAQVSAGDGVGDVKVAARQVVRDAFGNDPDVTLYRGLTPDAEVQPGQPIGEWWSSDPGIAGLHSEGGDIFAVKVKASELVDPSLTSIDGPPEGHLFRLAPELSQRAELAKTFQQPTTVPDYTVRDALGVARDLGRQVDSQVNRMVSRASVALRGLGRLSRGKDGNWYMDVGGQKEAVLEVLEFPDRFPLTPQQRKAAQEYAAAAETVKNEADIFGAAPKLAELEVGQNFTPRLAKTGARGREIARPSTGGRRGLAGPRQRSRSFLTARDGIDAGVQYAHPLDAFTAYARNWLGSAANTHVRNLLVPLSETSAMRVPPGLRAQHDALQQTLRSTTATLGRLDQRWHNVVSAYLNAAEPNIDELMAELASIRVGRFRGQEGRNFGRSVDDLAAERERVLEEIRALRPKIKDAIAQSKTVPAGRATVEDAGAIAPLLAGRDFPIDDAKRIARFYGEGRLSAGQLGTVVKGLKAAGRAIIPARAMGDMSALLNQLGAIFPTNPRQFITNWVKATADTFVPSRYDRWLSSEEVQDAAAHGVVLLGRSGEQSDFQFGSWIDRIPAWTLVGPAIRALQRNFEAVTTRNRVSVYNSLVHTNEAIGTPLDSLGKEQLGRALNRISGISNNRAGDAEVLAEFAPNFLRSSWETVTTAMADGTIEGQVARQYMRNLVVMTSFISAGVAYAQGRDVREVLNPIDHRALQRGQLRLNSNFGTVRVAGQDVSLYGRFDSFARLAVTAMDASTRAIAEQDAMELFDFIGFAGQSRGSPVASLVSSSIMGHTFGGRDPLSVEGLIEQTLPFTLSGFIEDYQSGVGTQTALTGAAINFFGGKANPSTAFEEFDAIAQEMFGRHWAALTGQEQQRLEAMFPDLARRSQRSLEQRAATGDEIATAIINSQRITEERLTTEGEAWTAYQRNDLTRDELADRLELAQRDAAVARRESGRGVEFADPSTPQGRALAEWYQTFEEAELAGEPDWDRRAELEAALFKRIDAGEFGDPAAAYKAINERAEADHHPEVRWYFQNKETIRRSGYWEVRDEMFERFRSTIARFDPSIQSARDLDLAIDQAIKDGDVRQSRILSTLRSRLNNLVGRQRILMRAQDPALQEALLENGNVDTAPRLN